MLFFKKKKIEVYAPVSGEVIKIENVKDPVFSNKMLGDGLAIIPSEKKTSNIYCSYFGNLNNNYGCRSCLWNY